MKDHCNVVFRNSQPVRFQHPAVNTTSQMWGSERRYSISYDHHAALPGERHMMSMMRAGDASLPASRSIPVGRCTIEQQLNVLMQQRAQQFIATLTSMDAASQPSPFARMNPAIPAPPTLELLRFLGQEGDRVTPRHSTSPSPHWTPCTTPFRKPWSDRATRPSMLGHLGLHSDSTATVEWGSRVVPRKCIRL
jgi:hypothetical protein